MQNDQASRADADIRDVVKALAFPGGIYVFAWIAGTMMPVFVRSKITDDPHGFTKEEAVFAETLFWVGVALGSLIVMPLSDRFGRRKPLYIFVATAVCLICVSVQATTLWVYAAGRFATGIVFLAMPILGYLVMVESLPSHLGSTMTVCLSIYYSVTQMLTALVTKNTQELNNWRLEWMLWCVPLVLVTVMLFFCMKPTDTENQGTNKTVVAESSESAFSQLVRPPFRKSVIATAVCWIACSLTVFGLNHSAGKITPELHMNIVYFSIVDLFANFVSYPILAFFGTMRTQLLSFLVAASALMACGLLQQGPVQLAIALVGRLGISIAFTTIYMLLVEVFPEKVRSTAAGIANFFARSATLASPIMSMLPSNVSCPLLGSLSVLAACATLVLMGEKGASPLKEESGARDYKSAA